MWTETTTIQHDHDSMKKRVITDYYLKTYIACVRFVVINGAPTK